jgi:hypothetical protein
MRPRIGSVAVIDQGSVAADELRVFGLDMVKVRKEMLDDRAQIVPGLPETHFRNCWRAASRSASHALAACTSTAISLVVLIG